MFKNYLKNSFTSNSNSNNDESSNDQISSSNEDLIKDIQTSLMVLNSKILGDIDSAMFNDAVALKINTISNILKNLILLNKSENSTKSLLGIVKLSTSDKDFSENVKKNIDIITTVLTNLIKANQNYEIMTSRHIEELKSQGVEMLSKQDYYNEMSKKSELLIDKSVKKSLRTIESKPIVKLAYNVAGYLGMKETSNLLEIRENGKIDHKGKNEQEYWMTPVLNASFEKGIADVRSMINENELKKREYLTNMDMFKHLDVLHPNFLTHFSYYVALIMSDRGMFGQTLKKETRYNIQEKTTIKEKALFELFNILDDCNILSNEISEYYGRSSNKRQHLDY